MASPATAIAAILADDDDVRNLTNIAEPGGYILSQQTFPQVSFSFTGTNVDRAYSGSTGLVSTKLIVKCLATTYGEADALCEAVKAALDDIGGLGEDDAYGGGVDAQGTPIEPVQVQGIYWEDTTEDYYANPANENITLYQKQLTFEMWYDDFTPAEQFEAP